MTLVPCTCMQDTIGWQTHRNVQQLESKTVGFLDLATCIRGGWHLCSVAVAAVALGAVWQVSGLSVCQNSD